MARNDAFLEVLLHGTPCVKPSSLQLADAVLKRANERVRPAFFLKRHVLFVTVTGIPLGQQTWKQTAAVVNFLFPVNTPF